MTATHRPASFDAAIIAYTPGLRKLAKRLRPAATRDDIDDMVQEALARARRNAKQLADWRSKNPKPYPQLEQA